MELDERIESIAKMCHQVNKAYCESIGDFSQVDWHDAEEWQKQSAINGVMYHLNNPSSKPCDSHNSWMKEKVESGWKYGEVKDSNKLLHPCIVPYEQLPLIQQLKDEFFIHTCRTMFQLM